jgi:hypothetical protein
MAIFGRDLATPDANYAGGMKNSQSMWGGDREKWKSGQDVRQ